jgi:hypothetical protein
MEFNVRWTVNVAVLVEIHHRFLGVSHWDTAMMRANSSNTLSCDRLDSSLELASAIDLGQNPISARFECVQSQDDEIAAISEITTVSGAIMSRLDCHQRMVDMDRFAH